MKIASLTHVAVSIVARRQRAKIKHERETKSFLTNNKYVLRNSLCRRKYSRIHVYVRDEGNRNRLRTLITNSRQMSSAWPVNSMHTISNCCGNGNVNDLWILPATFRTDRSTVSRSILSVEPNSFHSVPGFPPPGFGISDEFITKRKRTGQTRYLQTTESKLRYRQHRPTKQCFRLVANEFPNEMSRTFRCYQCATEQG